MPNLLIRVECSDPTDLDWIRTKAIGAVEDVVEQSKIEERFDGNVEVSWDLED